MTTTHHPRFQKSRQQTADQDRPARSAPAAVVAVRRIFAAETGNYFLLLGTTLFLVVLGLVMVLSSSSIESYLENNSDPFAAFLRQGLYALVGVPLMLVASRMPAAFWKRIAWPAIITSMAMQLLVFTPLGYGYGGNRNWISIGAFTAQPSELVKITLVLWIALMVSTRPEILRDWKRLAMTIAPVAVPAIGFVLIGNDLGTAVIMLAMVLGLLYFAGIRLRILATVVVLLGLVGTLFTSLSSSRSARINAWLSGCSSESDYALDCWQTMHGWWALASGGLFGVGLGNSKAKWSWLPEAANDFIFAIIGEELGLIGAVVVLLLFVVLAITFVRIIRANADPFARLAISGIMIWIVSQAMVNIAVVLGVLPVLGVPLPLISAGGSALIATLAAIGVALSFARKADDPEPTYARDTAAGFRPRAHRQPAGPMSPAERSRQAAAERARRKS